MKVIKYKLCSNINTGTEENPVWVEVLNDKLIRCSNDKLEANEAIAKQEAYNGVYTIEEDGESDNGNTLEKRVDEMEEALTALLEGATE